MKKSNIKTLLTSLLVILAFNAKVSALTNLNTTSMDKASYVDFTVDLSAIPPSGYAASNILLFAFPDVTTSQMQDGWINNIKTAINNEQSGTINFLSLGGQNGSAQTFIDTGIPNVISNIQSQINSINSQLTNGNKINGVDLDLEGPGWSADIINQLAAGFKQAGLLVSIAPQMYLSGNGTNTNVNFTNPVNLGMTPSGATNLYQEAVSNNNVDYIMAQTYNTGGWTVGGYAENQLKFFIAMAYTLSYVVQPNCQGATTICIPQKTKILIGELSDAGAGNGNSNNIFNSNGATSYDQITTLTGLLKWYDLATQLHTISGIVQWSLNSDYQTQGYSGNDKYATIGAFSVNVFGATPPPPLPDFSIEISNTGPNESDTNDFVSATLIVDGAYDIFGNQNQPNLPIGPDPESSTTWGTSTAANNNPTQVFDSSILDKLFSNDATSFTTSGIYINGYPSAQTPIGQPAVQYSCDVGTNYTFQAGHHYHLMLNSTYQSCAITELP